jgi:hypothetical protein
VDFRLLMLYLLVFLPSFLLTVGGALCTSIRVYRKRLTKDCELDDTNTFNLRSMKVLKRAENFMLLNTVWLLIGFTIWSLRNILTILELFHYDCMKNRERADRFFLFNFYLWTLIGYAVAVVTVVIIPGAALYQCYRATDRTLATHPYTHVGGPAGSLRAGSQAWSYSNATFDRHALASKRKL